MVSNIFLSFHHYTWGNWLHLPDISQMGWFNHQLEKTTPPPHHKNERSALEGMMVVVGKNMFGWAFFTEIWVKFLWSSSTTSGVSLCFHLCFGMMFKLFSNYPSRKLTYPPKNAILSRWFSFFSRWDMYPSPGGYMEDMSLLCWNQSFWTKSNHGFLEAPEICIKFHGFCF